MQSSFIKTEPKEYVKNNCDNIKVECCAGDTEYADDFLYHCSEELKGEEVNFEDHAYPISSISNEQRKTIKHVTKEGSADNIFSVNAGDSVTGILHLKSEELDLGCDCNEHSVNLSLHTYEHKNNVCEKNSCKKPHTCYICEKKFIRKDYLNKHILTHTGEKFECTVCNKKFTQVSSLNRHLVTHTGKKVHKCTICEKKFAYKNYLNSHMLTHAGERPHVCKICDMKFTRKSHLNLHMLGHTGETSNCTVCDRKFSRKATLNRHMTTHTGEKHKCKLCAKKFTRKPNLNKHMLTHTGDKD